MGWRASALSVSKMSLVLTLYIGHWAFDIGHYLDIWRSTYDIPPGLPLKYSYHNISFFSELFDVGVGFSDLIELVFSVDNGFEMARLNNFLELGHVVGVFFWRTSNGYKLPSRF